MPESEQNPFFYTWPEKVTDAEAMQIIESHPNVFSFEFFGRALAYSVDYDIALGRHFNFGIGISSYQQTIWWANYQTDITVVPLYMDYYFSQELSRSYISLGMDLIQSSNPGFNNDTFLNNGVAVVVGGGYEMQDKSGLLIRVGAYGIFGRTFVFNPFVGIGYAF